MKIIKNYLSIHKPNRPIRWIIEDGSIRFVADIIQVIESFLNLISLSTIQLDVSYTIIGWSAKRQLKRRKKITS